MRALPSALIHLRFLVLGVDFTEPPKRIWEVGVVSDSPLTEGELHFTFVPHRLQHRRTHNDMKPASEGKHEVTRALVRSASSLRMITNVRWIAIS
jgi:hypothetical protein